MNNIKAIIFDWAGTLVDYGCLAPTSVFVEVFAKRGIEVTLEQARGPMGLAKNIHLTELLKIDEIKKQWEKKYNRLPNEDDVDDLFSHLEPTLAQIVKEYSKPIPGAVEVVNELKSKGIKIGSTTGYVASMMKNVVPIAKSFGLEPDCIVNSSDVPSGRPKPYMCYLNAIRLDVFPFSHMIKVGDTVADIKEGINAGMWTIGFTKSGNGVGFSEEGIKDVPEEYLKDKIEAATIKLKNAGAHYIVDGIWDMLPIVEKISQRIENGEKP